MGRLQGIGSETEQFSAGEANLLEKERFHSVAVLTEVPVTLKLVA